MSDTLLSQCTVLVVTYNRPAMLAQQLHYLWASSLPVVIEILDSSAEKQAAQNEAVAGRYPNVRYRSFPASTPVFSKFAQGLAGVKTPYCVLLPDDDFLFLESLSELLRVLESDETIAATHGCYFEYRSSGKKIHITDIIQSQANLGQSSGVERVAALMGRGYEALTYAVCRTAPAAAAFAVASEQRSILAQELLAGTALAAQGKVLRLNFFSHGRRAESTIGYQHWHPMEWMAMEPSGIFGAYPPYREALLRVLAGHREASCTDDEARRIDLAHLAYLSRYLDADVLMRVVEHGAGPQDAALIFDLAREAWSEKYGPQWLKPLRKGDAFSRKIRHFIRRTGLRYKTELLRTAGVYKISRQAPNEVSIREVRFGFKFAKGVERNNLGSLEGLTDIASALALREHLPGTTK